MNTTQSAQTIEQRLRALEKLKRQEDQLIAERFQMLSERYINSYRVPFVPSWERERLLDRAEQEVRSERDAALVAEEERLRPLLIGSRRHAALREHAIAVATRHDTAIVLDPKEFGNARAYVADRRVAVKLTLTADPDYAEILHEIGHVLAEPCAGPMHFRVRPDLPGCIACEVRAWEISMQLAIAWSRPMHNLLASSLDSYLRTTPGVLQASDALRALSSDVTFKREQLRRMQIDHDRLVRDVAAARKTAR